MEANQMRSQFILLKEQARLANRTFNDREIQDFLNRGQLEITKARFAPWKNRPQIGYGQHPIRNSELSGLITATSSVPREYMIVGTDINGALPGPDLDQGDVTQDADKYGVFVGLPDEMLYPITEICETIKDTITKRNTPIKEISLQEYHSKIYDSYEKPYSNLVWAMDWGSYTASNHENNGTYTDSEKEYSSQGSGFNMQGLNYDGDTIDINTNRSRYLIPGKDWKVNKYTIHYIKLPRNIIIDVQTPSSQVNCELPDSIHDEIVTKAVEIASGAAIPDPNQYQVNKVESKEDE